MTLISLIRNQSQNLTTSIIPTTILINNPNVSSNPYVPINFNNVEGFFGSFFNNYKINSLSNTKVYYNYTKQEVCNYVYINKYYSQPGAVTANIINFSIFNKSKPLVVSFAISIINQSNMTVFSTQFYQNKGYCRNSLKNIISNSISVHSTYLFDNTTVYKWKLSNLTNDGLNLTGNHYSNVRPDLYWYFSKSLYKNTNVEIAVWGFNGYQNDTYINSQYNKFLSSFMNYTLNNKWADLVNKNQDNLKMLEIVLLISAGIVLFIVGVYTVYTTGIPTNNSIQKINSVDIGSIMNIVGYNMFNKGGYVIEGDINTAKFPDNGFGKISGYKNTSILGTLSFSESFIAFIFNNTIQSNTEAKNFTVISSILTYETNASVYNMSSFTYNNIPIKFYKTVVHLKNNTGYINIVGYVPVFVYKNVIFIGKGVML